MDSTTDPLYHFFGIVLAATLGALQGRADRVAKGGEVRYSAQDAVIALAYAQLAATEQGLASCWIGALDEAAVSRTLKLPRTLKPVALLPVGYAAEKARVSPRRPLSELVVDLGD